MSTSPRSASFVRAAATLGALGIAPASGAIVMVVALLAIALAAGFVYALLRAPDLTLALVGVVVMSIAFVAGFRGIRAPVPHDCDY